MTITSISTSTSIIYHFYGQINETEKQAVDKAINICFANRATKTRKIFSEIKNQRRRELERDGETQR